MAPAILTSAPSVCRGQFAAREYVNVDEMIGAYRAVHARLHAPPPPKPVAVPAPPPHPWDDQVIETLGADRIYRSPRRIIARTAVAHGLTSEDILGPSRKGEIFRARLAAIDAVLQLHPALSLPQLGRIFGGRDHTTMLNALRHLGRVPEEKWSRRRVDGSSRKKAGRKQEAGHAG